MLNKIQARTPILALILFVFAVGYTVAATTKVVVIPMGADAAPAPALPSGMVSSFNRETCPTGWTKYTNAQGRFVIGLNDGGTLGAREGVTFADRENREHNHIWADWASTDRMWGSFDNSGNNWTTVTDWGDGIGNEGSGFYPIAAFSGDANRSWYTRNAGQNSNLAPYVQLLYCEKV